MTLLRYITLGYFVALMSAASLNYIPISGIIDANGRAFGVFALDLFDDSLHVASALWALIAGALSHRASRLFLVYFGTAYLMDGVLGLFTGSGYLDFGIFIYGIYEYPSFLIKFAANLPHILLGGFAIFAAKAWGR